MKTKSSESKKRSRRESISQRVQADSQGATNMDGGRFIQTFVVRNGVSQISNTFGR